MNTKEEFKKEIEGYSREELELIYENQKDLYTEEEMDLICKNIEAFEQNEKEQKREKIEKLLPKEIMCPKCEGPNPFENDKCVFCGAKLEKAKYYDPVYYEKQNAAQKSTDESDKESNAFRYFISFFIPLIGYILGAILLSKDSSEERIVGRNCIILGIISTVIGTVIGAIVWWVQIGSMYL